MAERSRHLISSQNSALDVSQIWMYRTFLIISTVAANPILAAITNTKTTTPTAKNKEMPTYRIFQATQPSQGRQAPTAPFTYNSY
jgi:hypothetical protein